ncbi:MAG: helix-turn-helix transcriptional regulator [Balneolaceae bacterium]|nr:helix-turn-helix transcriptional regulator [Balneolaceae bacterium]
MKQDQQQQGRPEDRLSGCFSCKLEQLQELDRFRSENRDRYGRLTERELQVLQLVASGKPTSAIAETLDLSPNTVSNHRSSIRRKLQAGSFTTIYKYALAFELITF